MTGGDVLTVSQLYFVRNCQLAFIAQYFMYLP